MRNDGCFDAVLPYTARLPFRTKLAVSVTAITATETTEADETRVFDLAFTATELEPRKASATVVISTELARIGGDNATNLILRELSNGVIAGTDSVALAALIDATTPTPSSGDLLSDLAALLAAVPTGSSSRLFFVIEPSQAKILATIPGVNGAAFPQMNVNGGSSIGGVTVLVSGQLGTGSGLLFDATALAAASENVALSASREAVVRTAASPASSVSRWPQDLIALRAARWFGLSLLRADGVASLSGVDYTPTSP